MAVHHYHTTIEWTGNSGTGTTDYRAYRRDLVLRAPGKPDVPGSSDPAFRGDPARYSPEDLLVASLSACHMLWYLHLCATHGVAVIAYVDEAEGTMEVGADGGGRFTSVTLRPRIRLAAGDPQTARELHHRAHELCFIASSVNFPVGVEPQIDGPPPASSAAPAPGSPSRPQP